MKSIILPLEEYDQLLKCKKAIDERKSVIVLPGYHGKLHYKLVDNDEALTKAINCLQEKVNMLKNKLAACKLEQEEFNNLPWYKRMDYIFNEQNIEDVLLRSYI